MAFSLQTLFGLFAIFGSCEEYQYSFASSEIAAAAMVDSLEALPVPLSSGAGSGGWVPSVSISCVEAALGEGSSEQFSVPPGCEADSDD